MVIGDGPSFADDPLGGMQVSVEQAFPAAPEQVWDLLTDIPRMATLSPEVVSATWLDSPAELGSRFEAVNHRAGHTWTVTCHVVVADPPHVFAWCVSDPDHPSSTWTYTLRPTAHGTVVGQRFAHGPGSSLVRMMISDPDADVSQIIAWRSGMLSDDMTEVLANAVDLLEPTQP